MDFDEAIQILNTLLQAKQPGKITSSWILKNAPAVYRFIWKNIRNEFGVDWDRITIALKPEFQKLWIGRMKRPLRKYYNTPEVRKITKRYKTKMYTFVSAIEWDDKCARDTISIALVRLAQNGNVRAKQELTKLLSYTIEAWIADSPRVSKWQWYPDQIPEQIDRCIRCYRYTGSFIGYLFRTLEYAGRGLRPIFISSLDECFRDTEKRKIDNVVKDPETQEIKMFARQ